MGASPIKDVLLDIAATRPLARDHPYRGAADCERGWASNGASSPTPPSGSWAASTPRRGVPARIRVPCQPGSGSAATIAKPGTMFILAAGDPGPARGRLPIPGVGQPAKGEADLVAVLPQRGGPRRTGWRQRRGGCCRESRSPPTTRRRSDPPATPTSTMRTATWLRLEARAVADPRRVYCEVSCTPPTGTSARHLKAAAASTSRKPS